MQISYDDFFKLLTKRWSKNIGLHIQQYRMSLPLLKLDSGLEYQPIPKTSIEIITNEKPRIFLTTVKIPDEHIWANGLYQNVYIIYKMFEVMGYEPWLLVDNNEANTDGVLHKKFRVTDFKTYIKAPFPVLSYIEIAMSCDPSIRKFFRSMNSKTSKTYLGNILNIDIETITFYQGVNFSHHVAGELDEIFVSPHYDMHAEYAGSINGLCGKTRIAPYVWDPMFVENIGVSYDGSGLRVDSARTFVIMEPNISFQKNALIPIMALEAYYRKYPSRVDKVIVINGNKFSDNPFFSSSVLPNLTIMKSGKLHLLPRAHMINVVKSFRDAIIVQHQVNNAYNYSFLEWFTLGYPLVHNVARFKEYGYYYDSNDFDAACMQIQTIVQHHESNAETYKAHAKQLAWRFSIYNPDNTEVWKKIAFEKS